MAPKGKEKINTKGTMGKGSKATSKTSKTTDTDDNADASGSGRVKTSGKLLGGRRKETQQIYVRHILCEKISRERAALDRLRMGDPWEEVVEEFSEDKEAGAGGSLGWKRRGDLDPVFATAAFEFVESTLENAIWGQVRTGRGYHIFMVEGKRYV